MSTPVVSRIHPCRGTRACYVAGCRSDCCRTANRIYNRAYRRRRYGLCLVDLQRVRSLGAFLVREHGSIKAAARAAGVSYFALWRVLNDEGCCAVSVASRIVAAVKVAEENLRLEAHRDERRAENAQRELYRARAKERAS